MRGLPRGVAWSRTLRALRSLRVRRLLSLGLIVAVTAAVGLSAASGARITGTPGPDRLNGTALADTLRGLDGDDRLDGRAGPDLLAGGAGRDVLIGGTGSDRLVVQDDAERDTVRCGAGRDIVTAELVDTVAADCEVTLDIRYVPSQTPAGIRDEIQALADGVKMPGASFAVEIFKSSPTCEVSPEAPIVKLILKHAPDAKVVGSGGGTFANPLVQAGIQAVGWSPGNEETYHEPNEEIEIDQLTTFAGRLANLAFEICSMKT